MKRLALKSEYLSELTNLELASVAGGVTGACFTGVYPTFDRPCPSVQACIDVGPIPTTNCFTGTSGHTVSCNTCAC